MLSANLVHMEALGSTSALRRVTSPEAATWLTAPDAVDRATRLARAHDDLLAACRRHGYAPAAVHEARHPEFALGLVLAGTAVALVPRTTGAAGAAWRPLVVGVVTWGAALALFGLVVGARAGDAASQVERHKQVTSGQQGRGR